jgi:hypothetical protein
MLQTHASLENGASGRSAWHGHQPADSPFEAEDDYNFHHGCEMARRGEAAITQSCDPSKSAGARPPRRTKSELGIHQLPDGAGFEPASGFPLHR